MPTTRHPAAVGPRRTAAGPRAVAVRVLVPAVAVLAASGAWSPGAPATGSAVVATVYRTPVDGTPHVLRAFDRPPRPWLAGHRGVDLAAQPGSVVRSPAAGVVTFAGDVAGRGVVTVAHPDGRRSSLEPVRATVARGAQVAAGAEVGVVTGAAHAPRDAAGDAPPAVHWGVREGDTYVDPWALLPGRGPVVLLPVP